MGKKENTPKWGGRGVLEEGAGVMELDIPQAGRPPAEIAEMEDNFTRLEEYVDEAIAEQKIRYKGKRLQREDVVLIVKMLVLNRSNKDICIEVNKERAERGQNELSAAEIGVWRFRGRFKKVILAVRRYLFESMTDIFEYTNPIYVISKMNMMLNYLWFLGMDKGIKEGYVDRETQGVIKLWMQGVRQLNQMIQMNVEQIKEAESEEETEDAVAFLKKIRKKFGVDASEGEIIETMMQDRYSKQLDIGVSDETDTNDGSETDE